MCPFNARPQWKRLLSGIVMVFTLLSQVTFASVIVIYFSERVYKGIHFISTSNNYLYGDNALMSGQIQYTSYFDIDLLLGFWMLTLLLWSLDLAIQRKERKSLLSKKNSI